MSTATTRPVFASDAHLRFLDSLRESGAINMFGARPYLREMFPELSSAEASKVLSYWMESFEERQERLADERDAARIAAGERRYAQDLLGDEYVDPRDAVEPHSVLDMTDEGVGL